jgi:tRNA pseudouridine38-40 synthase
MAWQAMFFGFLGRAYQGFQRNPGAVTIEDALESAIYRAGGIMPSNYGELRKIGWSRSARTDKGVVSGCSDCSFLFLLRVAATACLTRAPRGGGTLLHAQSAASCCVGMKLCMPRPLAGMVAAINACLPPDITMHTMVPATNGFDAKNNCSQRRYEYLLPAYALGGPALGVSVAEGAGAADLAPSLEDLRTQLRYFCGTHSFHNYTPHLKSTDAQAKRYILSFEASDPFVVGGMALVRCTVLGQSFLMHQIRKMIGMAVMAASGRAPPHLIEASLAPHATFPTPMAPGLGLLLDETIFTHYNDRNRTAKEKQSQADRNVEPHTNVTVDSVRGAVEAYKLNTIYPSIVAEELRTKPFATFLKMADTNPVNYEMAATRALCAAVEKPGVVSWATSPQAAAPTLAGMLTHGYVYVDELAEDGSIGDGGGAKGPPPAMMGAETVAAVHRLLARRQAAREAKNYGEADATRAELRALGVTVFDAKQRAHHHPPLNTDDSEKQGETAAVSGVGVGGGGGSAAKGTWSVIHD